MLTLSELLKSTASAVTQTQAERLTAAVAKIAGQLEAVQADADSARIAHESALVDHAIDQQSFDDKALAKLKASDDAARDRIASLSGALATARARLSAAQASNARELHRDSWNKAVSTSDMRLEAVRRLDASTKAFAADYRAAMVMNGELYQALPANPDPDAALTHATIIETLVRKELLRLGVPWAFSWPYGASSIEPMLPQFEASAELVRGWAPKG
jgi:hypothetical protein